MSIDYLKDLSASEKDQENFINEFYRKLCQVTLDQEKYN